MILTTSADQEDIWSSYELQTNRFITMPVDMEQFTKAVECLGDSRFTLVGLPTPPKP
jgi:two-component system, chemotaxis family, response regulator Rcp1